MKGYNFFMDYTDDFRFVDEVDILMDEYENLVDLQEGLRYTETREELIHHMESYIHTIIENHYILSKYIISFLKTNPGVLERIRSEAISSSLVLSPYVSPIKKAKTMAKKFAESMTKQEIDEISSQKSSLRKTRNKEFDFIFALFYCDGFLEANEIEGYYFAKNEKGETVVAKTEEAEQDYFIQCMRRAYISHGPKIFNGIETLDPDSVADQEKFMIRMNKLGGRNGYQLVKEKE